MFERSILLKARTDKKVLICSRFDFFNIHQRTVCGEKLGRFSERGPLVFIKKFVCFN